MRFALALCAVLSPVSGAACGAREAGAPPHVELDELAVAEVLSAAEARQRAIASASRCPEPVEFECGNDSWGPPIFDLAASGEIVGPMRVARGVDGARVALLRWRTREGQGSREIVLERLLETWARGDERGSNVWGLSGEEELWSLVAEHPEWKGSRGLARIEEAREVLLVARERWECIENGHHAALFDYLHPRLRERTTRAEMEQSGSRRRLFEASPPVLVELGMGHAYVAVHAREFDRADVEDTGPYDPWVDMVETWVRADDEWRWLRVQDEGDFTGEHPDLAARVRSALHRPPIVVPEEQQRRVIAACEDRWDAIARGVPTRGARWSGDRFVAGATDDAFWRCFRRVSGPRWIGEDPDGWRVGLTVRRIAPLPEDKRCAPWTSDELIQIEEVWVWADGAPRWWIAWPGQ